MTVIMIIIKPKSNKYNDSSIINDSNTNNHQ